MKKLGVVQAVLSGKAGPFHRGVESAIDKQVLSGFASVKRLGIEGDQQADQRHHGGEDKALHLYPEEHCAYWLSELGEHAHFSAGGFGENLSTQGVSEDTICIADQIKIGTTLLEVTQGRMPCWKLNERFSQPDMALRLQMTRKTGLYFRVLDEGEIMAGDEILLVERRYPEWDLSRVMQLIFSGELNPECLRPALELPLPDSWRSLIEKRLETGIVENWSFRLFGSYF